MIFLQKVTRSGRDIILPVSVMDRIKAEKRYLTLNKIKRSYGIYWQAVVAKKVGDICYRTSLARYMMEAPKGVCVDHIDGNPLNNCPSNLRLATVSQNGANRKKSANTIFEYKGVSKKKDNYYAQCKRDGISYSCGPFKTEKEAAKAYNELAKFLHGDFAAFNIIK